MTPARLRSIIWKHYRAHRRDFPWRRTDHPYRILVSEVMLQQTKADRVPPFYRAFLCAFPTVRALARAPLRDVLEVWQGLGYNRRAKMLSEAAKVIVAKHHGRVPKTAAELEALPGIGPYTARAICAFSYNAPEIFIETNIRSVYIHFFFKDAELVPDSDIIPLLEQTLPKKRARDWYAALMDYGAWLKRNGDNPSRKSRQYVRQSAFKGSNRQIRGAILTSLVARQTLSKTELMQALKKHESARVCAQLEALSKEGFITLSRTAVSLA